MTDSAVLFNPTSTVLAGVPRVQFGGGQGCPEDICFPSVVRALLEYLQDDFGCNHRANSKRNLFHNCTFSYVIGVSGQVNYMGWDERNLYGVNSNGFMVDGPGSPLERTFWAIGYDYQYLQAQPGQDPRDVYREAIIESINRKMPLIAFGVAGPPEPAILTGYDQDGDVLTGWSFFQNFPEFNPNQEFDGNGYFRSRNPYAEIQALVVPGKKRELPKMEEIYKKTLPFLLDLIRTPAGPEPWRAKTSGLAAYESWAEWLLRDELFPADNGAVRSENFQINDSFVGYLAESRWYGSSFVSNLAMNAPDNGNWAEEVFHAAACLAAEHTLMWKMWEAVGGIGFNDSKSRAIADPEVRRRLSQVVLQARDKEAEAADWIERAIAKF